jgi:hypothetical protein
MWSENAGWTTHITYITPLADKLKSWKNRQEILSLCIKYQAYIISQALFKHTHVYWGEMGKCERRDWKLQYMMRRRWFVSNLTTINVKIARQPTFPIFSLFLYLPVSFNWAAFKFIRPVCGFRELILWQGFIRHTRCYWKWHCALLNWVSIMNILSINLDNF